MSPKIIKNGSGGYTASSNAFSLRSIDDECEKILSRAREEAALIRGQAGELLERAKKALEDVSAKVPQIEEEARTRGCEEGREQGIKDGIPVGTEQGKHEEIERIRKETEHLRANLQQIFAQVETRHKAMTAGAKRDTLQFAVKIAEKIVKARVHLDNEVVVRNIEAAIDLIAQEHKLQILINPAEAEAVEMFVPQLKAKYPKIEAIHLAPDTAVGRGCCIVRTSAGEVNSLLSTQLEEIERQLLQG